ncbi:MAG: hypothetical protein ACXVB5_11485 [Isosphaeraceae bacterium]
MNIAPSGGKSKPGPHELQMELPMIEDRLDYLQQGLVQMVLADHGLDDDDLVARAAYLIMNSHTEEASQALAIALFSSMGITPRKNRRRGRPRKRVA